MMLCSLLVTLALLACALAESHLRQAAPAIQIRKTFSKVRVPTVKGKSNRVSMMEASSNTVNTYITGTLFQVQTNSADCSTPTNSYKQTVYRLGVCRSHYKSTAGQPQSTMVYAQHNTADDSYDIRAQSFSDASCSVETMVSDEVVTTILGCEDGAKVMLASHSSPQYDGVVATMHFGSEAPTTPLERKYNIYSGVMLPLHVCVPQDSGSQFLTRCRIKDGNVLISGEMYTSSDCSGPFSSMTNADAGPVYMPSGPDMFMILHCITPAQPNGAPSAAPSQVPSMAPSEVPNTGCREGARC